MPHSELLFTSLIFALFVIPKVLMRFRVPAAITALGMGIIAGMGFGLFTGDPTVKLFATLGIVSLFLFAGLDVDLPELRNNAKVIVQHVIVGLFLLALLSWGSQKLLGLSLQAACIFALALLTPSAGFILDSLDSQPLSNHAKFWVRSKTIGTELVALAAMFVILQSGDIKSLGVSSAVLTGLILLLPTLFRFFGSKIAPLAPNSEFTFLLIIALGYALATQKLGAYYLMGAFLVGMVAHRFEILMPALKSEQMLHSIRSFSGFFIPFYFFHAGLGISRSELGAKAFLFGIALLVVVTPIRVLSTMVQRRLSLSEGFKESLPLSIALLPTLVFGLVLAAVLRTRFNIADHLFGGLIYYTVFVTVLPSYVLRRIELRKTTPPAMPPAIASETSVPPAPETRSPA